MSRVRQQLLERVERLLRLCKLSLSLIPRRLRQRCLRPSLFPRQRPRLHRCCPKQRAKRFVERRFHDDLISRRNNHSFQLGKIRTFSLQVQRNDIEERVLDGIDTAVAFMVHSSARPDVADYRGAAMTTIRENTTGSPINCDQNTDCSLFRKEVLSRLLQREASTFSVEAISEGLCSWRACLYWS